MSGHLHQKPLSLKTPNHLLPSIVAGFICFWRYKAKRSHTVISHRDIIYLVRYSLIKWGKMNLEGVTRFLLYLILIIIMFLSFSHYEIQNGKIIIWCLVLSYIIIEISLYFYNRKRSDRVIVKIYQRSIWNLVLIK